MIEWVVESRLGVLFDCCDRPLLGLIPTSVLLQNNTVTTHIIRMTHTPEVPIVSETPKDGIEKLVIIGSGPAAHTAAIYAARYTS